MDKMTLTVEKNIAIVPVFNLCNIKTIRFLTSFKWKYSYTWSK